MPNRIRRWSAASACALAVALFASAPGAAADGPPDPAALGPFAVGHTSFPGTFFFLDAARGNRPLPTHVWYPVDPGDDVGDPTFYALIEFDLGGPLGIIVLGLDSAVAVEGAPITDAGPLPIIVFSHGSGGINIQSTVLMERLASHGFVVVAPNHTGNTTNDVIEGTEVPFEQAALDRPADVSFVIDVLAGFHALSFPGNFLFGKLDLAKIGVAGHSFGGFTALAAAGGYSTIPPDPRVVAIMPIAPASNPLSDAELSAIEVPVLMLGASLDTTTPVDPNITRPYGLIPALPRSRAVIEGATHTHFANICDIAQTLLDIGFGPEDWEGIGAGALIGPYEDTCSATAFPIDEAQRIQALYAVSFFRREMVGDFRYEGFLTHAYAESNLPAVTFDRRGIRACGLGGESVLVVPLLWMIRRRRRRTS